MMKSPCWLSTITPVLPDLRQKPPCSDSLGYKEVARETERTAGELAIVALSTLRNSKGSDELANAEIIVHASINDQGMGIFWNPALALQEISGASHAHPLAIRQGCNGLLNSISLVLATLEKDGEAILVGSDRFEMGEFDRFSSDYGIMYGDGAVACMLSKRGGDFRILDILHVHSPELSALHDGAGLLPHDIRAAKKRYLESHGKNRLTEVTRNAMLRMRGLSDTYCVEHLIFPNLGAPILSENYFPTFDRVEERCASQIGFSLGHLGTIDQLVTLSALHVKGALRRGDRALLIGAGSGFSWTGIVVEAQ